MSIKKKILIICGCLVCLSTVFIVKTYAYDITEVDYIWDYLEKDSFFTGALRGVGWFIYVTMGMLLNLCYDTFTNIAQFDILKLPIVNQVITNLDVLSPYILIITMLVVLVIRLFDLKNMHKVFLNVFVATLMTATFSHVMVLMNDMKDVGIAEAANVVGVEEYRISDALLADNTVDIKKSLDNGSVQYLDKDNVSEFRHDLRLSKDYLDEDITDKNPDGTYNTESLSDGLWGIGEVYFYRYKTDYWALNVTIVVSIVIYVMAAFKMGYLLAQWLQENMFGGLLMFKGVWDFRSLGKIFKSILSTVFAIIEVYFMMLFFSYFCADIMQNAEMTNWLSKVIIIYAMGMMIIAGSGIINNALGIDDGSNFMLKSMMIGRRISTTAKAPARMASSAMELGAKGINAVSNGTDQIGSHLNSRYAGLLRKVSDMDMPDISKTSINSPNSPAPSYNENGECSNVDKPHMRDVSYDTMRRNNDVKDQMLSKRDKINDTNLPKGTNSLYDSQDSNSYMRGIDNPNLLSKMNELHSNNELNDHSISPDIYDNNSMNDGTNVSNDYINDAKEKYNESLSQEDKKYMESNIPEAKNTDSIIDEAVNHATSNDFINDVREKFNNPLIQEQEVKDSNNGNAISSDYSDALNQVSNTNNSTEFKDMQNAAPSYRGTSPSASFSNNSNVAKFNEMQKSVENKSMQSNANSNLSASDLSTENQDKGIRVDTRNDTVSTNTEHVKRMQSIINGDKTEESHETAHRYPKAEDINDLINSLNEFDSQKGGNQ